MHGALKDASMRVRYECTRLASHYRYPLAQTEPCEIARFEDYECLWRYFEKQARDNVGRPLEKVSPLDWKAAGEDFAGISLKGKLSFCSTNVGPLFQLQLKPLRKERSCRFQRAFGGDRFLYLSVPALTVSNLPPHLKSQLVHVQASYREWLRKEKKFLGCTWVTLLVEKKTRKPGRVLGDDEIGGQSVVLFATEVAQRFAPESSTRKENRKCLARSTISIEDVINWFLPTQENLGQLQCKAYARLELGFSKTLPTLTFLPSQIREVPDTLADGTAESTCFLEKGQRLREEFDPKAPKVMNDGCARLSVGAARQIARDLGLAERPPKVFQARIGCWKGLWMVDGRKLPLERQDDIWIEVTPSQRKFHRHPEDLKDDTFDPRRTTFEVVTWSTPPTSGSLSPTLIPILVDRGVPEQALRELFQASLAHERESLMNAAQDPQLLYRWVYSKASVIPGDQEDTEKMWLGSLPFSKPKAALYLLEHGFLPHELPYLAQLVRDLMQKHLGNLKKYLKPRVGRSVNVFAVADPLGCLEPGEVHLAFSENIIDEQSGSNNIVLHDVELVLGRQPALRGSDMQKVRGVFKPELKHLLDVIVFPSKGIFPLAERMGNGDYDGDTFWVTWDPAIVNNFENAPSPPGLPSPESFGIQVDDRKLDVGFKTSNKKATREFLDFNLGFRCQSDYLGICTNFHNSYAYTVGSIKSVGVEALADLHDLLVDSSKMGYTFTEDGWKSFIESDPRITHRHPESPLHKRRLKDGSLPENPSPVPKDAVDRLLILTIMPRVDAAMREVENLWSDENIRDEILCRPLRTVRELAEMEPCYGEDLNRLIEEVKKIYRAWKHGLSRSAERQDPTAYIEKCYGEFRHLKPVGALWNLHQEMEELISPSHTAWDLLKASATYVEYPADAFTLRMAGKELGFMKAWSGEGARTISPLFYAGMKLKAIKHIPVREHEELEEV